MSLRAKVRGLFFVGAVACQGAPSELNCDGVDGVAAALAAARESGGFELTLRPLWKDGVPVSDRDFSSCFGVEAASGGAVVSAVAPRAAQGTATLLLVDPGRTPAEAAAQQDLVQLVVNGRPPRDRIAIFRWGATVSQVATFHTDRAFTSTRLAGLAPSADSPLPAPEALALVGRVLSDLGVPGETTLRTVIVVGARISIAADAIAGAAPHLVVAMGPSKTQVALPQGLRFSADDAASQGVAVNALSDRLRAYESHGLYRAGVCGDGDVRDVFVMSPAAPKTLAKLPKVLPENLAGICDASRLARNDRTFSRKIELILTPEQRQKAEDIYAAGSGPFGITNTLPPWVMLPPGLPDPKAKFELSVRLSPGQKPAAALGNFRGESSYRCKRRNFTINLDGKQPRHPFPGAAASKFHLVAMCLDRLYLRNLTAMTLLAEDGLFLSPFDVVELVFDGQTQGLYIMVEDIGDSIAKRLSGVTGVLRRYKDNNTNATFPDTKWVPNQDDAAFRAGYERILGDARNLHGVSLERAIDKNLYLDGYMRWLATMTALGSGDYVDEVYFYATASTSPDGTPQDVFAVSGWDQDDLFNACHFTGRASVLDPDGLSHCAEAELDKVLLGDPILYGRYVKTLQAVLARLTPQTFARVVGDVAARLLDGMRDKSVLAAMTELQRMSPGTPLTFALAQRLYQDEVDFLSAQFNEIYRGLTLRIAADRSKK